MTARPPIYRRWWFLSPSVMPATCDDACQRRPSDGTGALRPASSVLSRSAQVERAAPSSGREMSTTEVVETHEAHSPQDPVGHLGVGERRGVSTDDRRWQPHADPLVQIVEQRRHIANLVVVAPALNHGFERLDNPSKGNRSQPPGTLPHLGVEPVEVDVGQIIPRALSPAEAGKDFHLLVVGTAGRKRDDGAPKGAVARARRAADPGRALTEPGGGNRFRSPLEHHAGARSSPRGPSTSPQRDLPGTGPVRGRSDVRA